MRSNPNDLFCRLPFVKAVMTPKNSTSQGQDDLDKQKKNPLPKPEIISTRF